MEHKVLLDTTHVHITLNRLCHQLIEAYDQFENTVLIGIQPRGVHFSNRLYHQLLHITGMDKLPYGQLDITFYRDDFRRRDEFMQASNTHVPFSLEHKKVVLIDDVLYTGRTIRAAMDALLAFGRPSEVNLCVFVDRRFSRELPISAQFIGNQVDSLNHQKVKVCWQETDGKDEVILYTRTAENR